MALDDDIAWFERHPLLGRLEREALRLVAFSADRRSFRAGDVLARKGEAARTGFLIVSGALALDPSDDGRPAQLVAGEGALVGELALFTATHRPANIMAREPTTVLVITRETMHRVLSEFPDSAAAVHAALSGEIRRFAGGLMPVSAALQNISEE